jgi:LysR family pca operon transcriptional activator
LTQNIKFRHLVCFLEVARLKSVVKAAEVLMITQPAVSKTLRELEENLNVSLFDRSHRNVALTRFGEVFLQYAGASVTALRQGIDSIGQARASHPITVKVGALPTVSARVLPRAVKLFTDVSLGSKAQIVTGPNSYLMAQLRLGDVDFVIGRMAEPETMLGFSFEYLYAEKVIFVVRPNHPLLEMKPFEFDAIADYPILMPPHGSVIRPIVDRFLVSHGIAALQNQVETVSMAFGGNYTRASDAIWIISEGVVIEDIADQRLAALPIDTSQTLGPVGLTKRAGGVSSLPVELLIQAIRDAAINL